MIQHGIFMSRAKYLDHAEWFPMRPSLRLNVSAEFTTEHINLILSALKSASKEYL